MKKEVEAEARWLFEQSWLRRLHTAIQDIAQQKRSFNEFLKLDIAANAFTITNLTLFS